MSEILAIITATNAAYRDFIATNTDQEIKVAVGNAVRFLTADLKSAAALVATREG